MLLWVLTSHDLFCLGLKTFSVMTKRLLTLSAFATCSNCTRFSASSKSIWTVWLLGVKNRTQRFLVNLCLGEQATEDSTKEKREHIQNKKRYLCWVQRDSKDAVILSQDDNLHLKRFHLVQSASVGVDTCTNILRRPRKLWLFSSLCWSTILVWGFG